MGRPYVRQAAIAITYSCPCRCEFCSAYNMQQKPGSLLTTEDIEKLIDDFAELGCLSICFSGGEPASHVDVCRLIRHVRKKGMFCSIITSCVTYSDELWEQMKEAGINTMYLSVDAVGEQHDRFRGVKGLFNKIELAVKKCKELEIEFYFNGVVTNSNIENRDIYRLIEYCQKNNINLIFLLTSANGKYANHNFLLKQENLKEFQKIRKLKNVFWEGDTTLKQIGCPAGIQVVFVSGYGEVLPCPFIEVSFGNVKNEGLARSVQKMWSYRIFGSVTPVCLMGEDREFYNDWLGPLQENEVPLYIEDHPQKNNKDWHSKKTPINEKN